MKFVLPIETRDVLEGVATLRGTREYRLAKISVLLQLVAGSLTIGWYWRFLPPQVPMWYSMPWGTDRLASPYFLFLPLVLSLVIFGFNNRIIAKFGVDHLVFARILYLVSSLVSLLSLIIVVRIVTLVS